MSAPASLHGIRVLDLTRVLAGPWATQTLADLGADVIKVERPGAGDDTRGWGPPFATDAEGNQDLSAYFLSANRGKRSITVDMASDVGREIVCTLADTSDVLIENFKAGGLASLGLDYETLSRRNPRLIYCSITGFGQTGPHRDRTGYDLLVQAMGGLMSLTGEPDGRPVKVGVAIADMLTGLYATSAVLAAVVERVRSGKGQHIDLALFDVQIATLANQAQNYLVGGRNPRRHGNAHPNIVPYQDFATGDGRIVVAVGNDAQFARFAHVIGRPDLASDERYALNSGRVRNRNSLLPAISERLATGTTGDWVAALDREQIPVGAINTLDAVFNDPQIAARELLVTIDDGRRNTPLVGSPIKMSRTPVVYLRAPPRLGEHTEEILKEILRKTEAEIGTLKHGNVI